jgi:DNA-directed RNA polymerase specialized sigma24 family protein
MSPADFADSGSVKTSAISLMNDTTEMTQVCAAARGDQQAWRDLLARHEARLRRLIGVRLHPRLRPRLELDDVVQEVYLEAAAHLGQYVQGTAVPFFLWLRGIACHKILALHRQHLGTQMRDAGRRSPSAAPWRRPPRRWRRSSWPTTPGPARRPSAPSGSSGFRKPSIA